MTKPLSFKLERPHVEAISGEFFRMWRLQMDGKARELDGKELDDHMILWITWLEVMHELDAYFAARVQSPADRHIKITLSMAQAMCLYRAVMHLPLPDNQHYLLLVRSTLLEYLFSFLINLPITIKPVRRQLPMEDYEWE